MIRMNRDHPCFDPVLELLATLPDQSAPARTATLTEDFGFRSLRAMRPLIDDMRERFGGISFAQIPGMGRCVWLTPDGYARAKRAAEAYWSMVYGEQPAVTEEPQTPRLALAI